MVLQKYYLFSFFSQPFVLADKVGVAVQRHCVGEDVVFQHGALPGDEPFEVEVGEHRKEVGNAIRVQRGFLRPAPEVGRRNAQLGECPALRDTLPLYQLEYSVFNHREYIFVFVISFTI